MAEQKSMTAGVGYLSQAAVAVVESPKNQAAQVASAFITMIVTPLWGSTLTWIGWLATRDSLAKQGLAALGHTLAPIRARDMYKDGVWRGLWRVHGLSVAFAVLQAPIVCLALLPAAIALVLLEPAKNLFPDAVLGQIIAEGIPALIAFAGLTVIAGQTMLAWRVLASLPPPYPIGLVFQVIGATWRATLREGGALMVIGVLIAAMGLVGGAFVYGSTRLAGMLELDRGVDLVEAWTGLLVGLAVLAISLESVARWAEDAKLPVVKTTQPWVFTDWLWSWLGAVFHWFGAQGFLAVGTAACLIIGLLTAVVALAKGYTFSSWVGLGWFAVTAAVLVILRIVGRKS